MKIIKARTLGFCMGVRRAVELAEAEALRASACGTPVYSLGSLVHNPRVLADLENMGVRNVDELPQKRDNCSVIIRAHGIDPNAENELRNSGVNIVDATCPNVKASQMKAEELVQAGYNLFIAGEANHAEIIGIMGYMLSCNAPFCKVVGNTAEAGREAKKLYSINNDAKTALLGQTTISEDLYNAIGEAVGLFFPNLELIQTICGATKDRQNALREFLDQVDAVIVAGGKDSANTRSLLTIAQKSGKPCVLAEDKTQIPESFFSYNTVGLCAGASTPDSVIDEIEKTLFKVE